MAKRYMYAYFLADKPEAIREIAPAHIEFWKERSTGVFLGGAFADLSGGMISFEAENMAEARLITIEDPFFTAGLIETKWIKQWVHLDHLLRG